jgi:hypothetical protein
MIPAQQNKNDGTMLIVFSLCKKTLCILQRVSYVPQKHHDLIKTKNCDGNNRPRRQRSAITMLVSLLE